MLRLKMGKKNMCNVILPRDIKNHRRGQPLGGINQANRFSHAKDIAIAGLLWAGLWGLKQPDISQDNGGVLHGSFHSPECVGARGALPTLRKSAVGWVAKSQGSFPFAFG